MTGLLKKWFAGFTKSQQRRPASRPNRTVRLGLESLETRLVPAFMMGGFTHAAPLGAAMQFANNLPPAQVRVVAPAVHTVAVFQQAHVSLPSSAIPSKLVTAQEGHQHEALPPGHSGLENNLAQKYSPVLKQAAKDILQHAKPAVQATTPAASHKTSTASLANKNETAQQGQDGEALPPSKHTGNSKGQQSSSGHQPQKPSSSGPKKSAQQPHKPPSQHAPQNIGPENPADNFNFSQGGPSALPVNHDNNPGSSFSDYNGGSGDPSADPNNLGSSFDAENQDIGGGGGGGGDDEGHDPQSGGDRHSLPIELTF